LTRVNDFGGDLASDVDDVRELRIKLHLANRELAWVRAKQERQVESIARLRRRRAGLRDQVDALSEALAETLSAAYWEAQRPSGRLRRSSTRDEAELVREVEAQPLFDGAWYLRKHAAAVRGRTSPAAHYVRQDRHVDPGPDFSAQAYLTAHPEAADAGVPLLVHAVRNGWVDDGLRSGGAPEPVTPHADVHV
jgi:hypothetical protein